MKTIHEISLESRLLEDELSKLKIGDFVSYAHLRSLIGRDVQAEGYSALWSARRRLLKSGVVVDVVRGEGVRRLADADIINSAAATFPRIRRLAFRGQQKLSAVQRFNELSAEQQAKHNSYLSALGVLRLFTRKTTMKTIEERVTEAARALPSRKVLELFK
jgi:hypothetical protein